MPNLKCPHCGQVFTVDGNELDSIIKQIRDGEFKQDVEARVNEVVHHLSEKHEVELKASEAEIRLKAQEQYEKEILKLNEKLQKAESDNQRLLSTISEEENRRKLEVIEAVDKVKDEKFKLERKLETEKQELERRLTADKQELERQLNADKQKLEKQLTSDMDELKRQLVSEKEKHELVVSQKDAQIEFYKDLKTKMSTKMIGETLEQHCELQFNQLRATAFRNAYFEKDNDARTGSKGDYIFRENDAQGNEIISIMFEMKNEMETTATKHKNEDFFKELDKDRREKGCEYAVLVSLLESESELYNAGIVDVSHRYEKMYVVRPQCFIPIITLLRNAALNAVAYKQELALIRNQNIDITHFEEDLMKFKCDFGRNYDIAHDHFNKAIDEIDKTITHLEKVKAELLGSDNQLRIANNKVDDVSVKRLTKNNPTMQAEFEKLRKEGKNNSLHN